jgi:hypothetical protein
MSLESWAKALIADLGVTFGCTIAGLPSAAAISFGVSAFMALWVVGERS